jgi:hypothetical protein
MGLAERNVPWLNQSQFLPSAPLSSASGGSGRVLARAGEAGLSTCKAARALPSWVWMVCWILFDALMLWRTSRSNLLRRSEGTYTPV